MKTRHLLVVALALSSIGAAAQLAQVTLTTEPTVVDRGPHHRTWQRVVESTRPDGSPVLQTNSYVQLENGAHYQNANGEWVESEERIEILNGIGIAERGLHKVTFSPNIRTAGGIDLLTPDGKRLRSSVMCLAYTDGRTGQTVLIAEPKDSIGEVAGNQVIYPDAFTDFIADVRYTYTKAGLEQDIIFLENPPSPATYGFDPETTRLEVFTEFVEAPVPEKYASVLVEETNATQRQAMLEPDLTDEYLSFGAMAIGAGRGFPANGAADEDNSVPVGKAWVVIEQRTFLIEKVDYGSVRAELQKLPQAAALRLPGKSTRRDALLAQLGNRDATRQRGALQLAHVKRAQKGFVLDYQIATSASNVTFQGDTTYYVAGTVTLSGTTVIEGGAVIKYTNSATSRLLINGPINCQTAFGRPAFFVSKDDDTIGESIVGSTGIPTGYYAVRAFDLNYATNFNLHNIRIRHASRGVYLGSSPTRVDLSHSQIGNGDAAVYSTGPSASLRNVLVHGTTEVFHTANGKTNWAEHLTSHQCPTLRNTGTLFLTNSILIATTNGVVFTGSNVETNHNNAGIFQTVGGASHYVANSTPYRNVGTTNINPSLLADLRHRTVFPPVVLTNHITSATTLSLVAERDTGLPELGYHYDPLDFVVNGIDVSSALTVKAGTAIGVYGATNSYGFQIIDGGSISFTGSATEPCKVMRYNMVQEQATANWATTSVGYSISTPVWAASPQPIATFRFTEWDMPASGAEHFYAHTNAHPAVIFVHCQFGGGRLQFKNPGVVFTNCLLDRVQSSLVGVSAECHNSLFYGGALTLSQSVNPFVFTNNLFDKTTISQSGTVTHDFNGYITNAAGQWLTNGGSNNVFTNAFTYETGVLGRFYQPTNSLFLDRGSTNANLLQLYHFTVLNNNVKETNSIIDLGFHRVAAPGGVPPDWDGDAWADYLEDADGDGSWDPGVETNWQDSDTDDDGVNDYLEWLQGRSPLYGATNDVNGVINLRVYTPLK